MAALCQLAITICYANYSILLFQKQDFSPRFSAIYLTLLYCGTYSGGIISPLVGFVCVTEKALPANSCLIFARIAPGNAVTEEIVRRSCER
jgi:hypothetical protein